ncbi:MAG: PilZ domain-containing protein [Myxococcota bacterium]|nr:PilZ domain-containing protein [Myxococcota bacterium]
MRRERHVLLVDVGPESMEGLSGRVRRLGLRTVRAKTSDEAVAAFRDPRFRIGAVVIPPELPALDLERAVAALRGAGEGGELPLLAAGTRPDADLRARLRRAGVRFALWSPVDEPTLRFQLNRALADAASAEEKRARDRRALRVPAQWPVEVSSGGRCKAATLTSLSASGAFLATPRPSLPRALLHFTLPLPSGDMRVAAEVVMTNVPGNLAKRNLPLGMGVRFRGVSDEVETQVRAFTEERAQALQV